MPERRVYMELHRISWNIVTDLPDSNFRMVECQQYYHSILALSVAFYMCYITLPLSTIISLSKQIANLKIYCYCVKAKHIRGLNNQSSITCKCMLNNFLIAI